MAAFLLLPGPGVSMEPGQAANSEIHGLKLPLQESPNPDRLTSELENSLLGLLISTHPQTSC